MRSPVPAIRRGLRRDLRRLRSLNARLRKREGTLSFHLEQCGLDAAVAATTAAALQGVLSDHLVPAAEALESAIAEEAPGPEEPPRRVSISGAGP